MDGFWQVDVIVEGALDAFETFEDEGELTDYLDVVGERARKDGLVTEVFVLYHGHSLDDEDEDTCAQYVTDHHPQFAYNDEIEGDEQ